MLAYKTYTGFWLSPPHHLTPFSGIEPPDHSLYIPDKEVLIAFRSEPCDQSAGFSLR